jgi:hypothetical protein
VASVEVTEYRVDATHNNWWREWKAFREAEGIPYVAGANHTHLGSNLRYQDKYAPWHNDVIGTLREEDVPTWLDWAAEHADRMALEATAQPVRVPVVNGVADLRYTIPAQGTLLLELRYADTAETLPVRLLTGPGGWDAVHNTVFADGAGKGGGPALKLLPGQEGAQATRRVTGLAPDTVYTIRARTKASGRVMDYGVFAEGPDGRVTGWGDRSARWNRIAASARSDGEGNLTVGLEVPGQPCDTGDHILYADVELLRTGW